MEMLEKSTNQGKQRECCERSKERRRDSLKQLRPAIGKPGMEVADFSDIQGCNSKSLV